MTQAWQLAQMNIGTMLGPKGDPRVQPFYDALDEVNALAEASPGFVWRPTQMAFTFKQRFPAPDEAAGGDLNPDGICVGWE